MKKTLWALLLCLVLVLSAALVSCGNTSENEAVETDENGDVVAKITDDDAVTVTLYSITNKSTTQEQIEVVEKAFNNITETKYNTHVVLKLYTEDEYDDVVDAIISKKASDAAQAEKEEEERAELEKQARLNGETLAAEETSAPEEAVPDIVSGDATYPGVKNDQIDIFLVRSFEDYYKMAVDGSLAPIDEELNVGSKLLNSYVYPTLIRAAKVGDATYGVFNNTLLGDYTYILFNKELVDKYGYDPEEMAKISTIQYFLEDVKANEKDVIPFLGDLELPAEYLSSDGGVSLLGAYLGDVITSSGTQDALKFVPKNNYPKNIISTSGFTAWAKIYNELYHEGIFVEKTTENENSTFGATLMKGDVTMSPTYADVYGNYKTDDLGFKYTTIDGVDYYVSVYKRPLATNENVFNAGYVISADTESVTRCMEVITALNTDASLANIFAYGVEGTHYTLNEDGVVHKLNNTYSMNLQYVGNIYLLKQSDDMDANMKFLSDNGWQNVKNTNRESTYSAFLGFYYNPQKIPLTDDAGDVISVSSEYTFQEVIDGIQAMSKDYLKEVLTHTCAQDEDYETYLRQCVVDTSKEGYIAEIASGNSYYMGSVYNKWYEEHYGVSVSS